MLAMERIEHEGIWFILLTPENPDNPPFAIECTGEKSCASLAWMISKNSRNIQYLDSDPEGHMRRK